jgi:hypothetical protein
VGSFPLPTTCRRARRSAPFPPYDDAKALFRFPRESGGPGLAAFQTSLPAACPKDLGPRFRGEIGGTIR